MVQQHNLRYTEYLGDGDSQEFSTNSQGNIYGSNVNMTKLECRGHIQKRVGRQLMTLVDQHKNEVFFIRDKEGQCLKKKKVANKSRGEKLYCELRDSGHWTAKAIKSIQGHYCAAIRGNDN